MSCAAIHRVYPEAVPLFYFRAVALFTSAGLRFVSCLTVEYSSERHGEQRTVAYGYLRGYPLVVVYTERGDAYRLISARLATRDEEEELMRRLGIERRKQRKEGPGL